MSLRITKSGLKLAPIPDPTEPVDVVYSASTTGSGTGYHTISSSSYPPLYSNTTYPNGGNTTGGNIMYPDSPNQDSDDPTHLNPIDPDNDTVWNVARLTLYGKPEDNKKLREYMIAGWEPFSTIEKDHQQILFLRRLEVV
jgi:hypothetical protein